jgi:hypothetical protein
MNKIVDPFFRGRVTNLKIPSPRRARVRKFKSPLPTGQELVNYIPSPHKARVS